LSAQTTQETRNKDEALEFSKRKAKLAKGMQGMAAGAVSCLIADFRLESECPASLFRSGDRLHFLLLRDGMQINSRSGGIS
jgi:hypothetical protein